MPLRGLFKGASFKFPSKGKSYAVRGNSDDVDETAAERRVRFRHQQATGRSDEPPNAPGAAPLPSKRRRSRAATTHAPKSRPLSYPAIVDGSATLDRYGKDQHRQAAELVPGGGGALSQQQQFYLDHHHGGDLALPVMPSQQELDAKFAQIVDELGLSRELMFQLSSEKKWQLYLEKQSGSASKPEHTQPEYYIKQIDQMTSELKSASIDEADEEKRLKLAKNIKTALRTQPLSYVLRFIEHNGLECVLDFLRNMNNQVRQSQLHYTLLGCVKAIMNNANGRAHVLAHPTGITTIAQSLKSSTIKIKVLVLEILGALCLVPGGHKKVLNAMMHFQYFAMEKSRFQTLVQDLAQTFDSEEDTSLLQIAILSFINAIINYRAGEESLEFRMHLRYEFIVLGILPMVHRLRALNMAQLDRHLDIFDLVRVEDEKELANRLDGVEVDPKNLKKMVELLQKRTTHSEAHTHLLSIVYHFLLLPMDDPMYHKYWHLIDRLVQQVVLQQDQGMDPDTSAAQINVQSLVHELLKEDEMLALKVELGKVRKTKDELVQKLRKKEWEYESHVVDRDQLTSKVEKLRVKLERKSSELTESWTKQKDLERTFQEAQLENGRLRQRISLLEALMKDKNVSFEGIGEALSDPSSLPTAMPPPPPAAPAPPPLAPPSVPIPAPPPPLPSSGAPPPPPPTPGMAHPAPCDSPMRKRRKQAPKPSQALKSFNWTKVPDLQAEKTIWSNLNDSKVYEVMNLQEFESMFSAYQRKESINSPSATLKRQSQVFPGQDKQKELSVIESQRAQNCTIILSKIKMSNSELSQVILSMDPEEKLTRDTVEQLLKFIPSLEEVDLLKGYAAEMDVSSFAKADRFLLEMSQIPRYSQRLHSLYYKKTLGERVGDIHPHAQNVLDACKELTQSKRLQCVLQVILAFGNFMNQGRRGNALGFRLSSLNNVADTKSSTDKEMTLLHYLVKTLEEKFPDALKLESELPHVRNAAKVNLKELEKEFQELRGDLDDVKREVEYFQERHKGEEEASGGAFLAVMESFASSAQNTLKDLEQFIQQMKKEFEKTMEFFGEEVGQMTCDEFFGIFSSFMQTFQVAHAEIEATRKKQIEEEKRKEEKMKQKERTLQRQTKRQKQVGSLTKRGSEYLDNGEFDDLILSLRSGDYFDSSSSSSSKKRRSFVHNGSSSTSSTKNFKEANRERLSNADLS